MNDLLKGGLTIIAGIIGLAIWSVFLSKNSSAPAAIQAGGTALSSVIGAAVTPVSAAQGANDGNLANNPFSSILAGSNISSLGASLLQGSLPQ
jgi:hypothetical protein